MKKTTKLAKRILSVMLSLMIISSFALVSVSAIPADYTPVGNVITQDFESSYSPITLIGAASMALSNEKALSGTSSLKIVENSDGVAKVKISESIAGTGANNYYLSFWYYTENTDVNMKALAGQEGESFTYTTIKGANGWTKAIFKITAPSTFNSYLAFGDYGNAGAVIYIDDLEFTKVESLEAKVNEVPAGAEISVVGRKDFDTDKTHPTTGVSTGIGTAFAIKSGSATRAVSADAAHWGERSLAITGDEGNTGNVTLYFHPRLFMPEFKDCDDILPVGTYYFSYYVYSPNATVSTSAVSNIGSVVASTSIPQGEWTKVSGTFDVASEKVNSGIFDLTVSGIGENTVYVDDLVLAQLSSIDELSLTLGGVEYNDGAATVTVDSNIDLKTAVVEEAEGITVNSTVFDGNNVTMEVSGLSANSEYTVLLSVRDAFDRVISRYVTFKTPMTISASSIADGATDVLAPVGYIYIDAPSAINAETLEGNITITGENATVTDATLADEDTIKISLDGVLPLETYTLSIDGVENMDGGELIDSITFSTTTSNSYALDFEEGLPSQFVWTGLGYGGTCNLSDNAYTGSQSVALFADSLSMGYVSFGLNGIKPNTAYRISFYYSSKYWGGNITSQSGAGTWTNSVISDTEKDDWKKVTVDYTSDAGITRALVQLYNFFAAGANSSCVDTVYIDDLKVQEIANVCQPIMVKDGAYVTDITAGTTEIEIPVLVDTTNINAYAVQYDANGKMLRVVEGTSAEGVINITLADAEEVETKIIFIDTSANHAPAFDYLQFN